MSRSIVKKAVAVAVAAAVLFPAAAQAQSSTEGYGGPNNVVAGVGDSGPSGPTDSGTAGAVPTQAVQTSDAGAALPFTGADLGVLLAAGAMLLALGLGLRRLTHRPSDA